MTQLQNIQAKTREWIDNSQIILDDYPQNSALRNLNYILDTILICFSIYLWLEFAEIGEHYQVFFPILFSFSIVLGQFILVEFGGRLIHRFWKTFKITIAKFWLVSFSCICITFLALLSLGFCKFVCQLTGSYCPVMWNSNPPNLFGVMFRIVVVPWIVSIVLLTLGIQKRLAAQELNNIKQVSQVLKKEEQKKQAKLESDNDELTTEFNTLEDISGFINFPIKNGLEKIALDDILYISVEDHYCRLVYHKEGVPHEELMRLTLKETMARLPNSQFAQIHRSHFINLHHIKQIKKEGQAYQVAIRYCDRVLPASRHRAQAFLPKLNEILRKN